MIKVLIALLIAVAAVGLSFFAHAALYYCDKHYPRATAVFMIAMFIGIVTIIYLAVNKTF